MCSDDFDPESPENKSRGVELYGTDDNFFRKQIVPGDLLELPNRDFGTFYGKEDYQQYTQGCALYVFIDLRDILKYLRVDVAGRSVIDIKITADITCDYLGDSSAIGEILWETFEEEISTDIQARLGSEEIPCIHGEPFNEAIEAMYDISFIIQKYLVNAQFPLVENESVYTAEKFERGLLVLRLRNWDELVRAHVGD